MKINRSAIASFSRITCCLLAYELIALPCATWAVGSLPTSTSLLREMGLAHSTSKATLAQPSGNPGGAGGQNGLGSSDENRQGDGQTQRTPRYHEQRKGGVKQDPTPVIKGAPAANLPNLDALRELKPGPRKSARTTFQPNLVCADCDPSGFGGYLPPNDPRYERPRDLPANQTGQRGVDLGSRNFNWSAPLLSLPGRAGLDLSLALTYNSLVWTTEYPGIKFDADRGFPGPGFHLGFPSIQSRYLNAQGLFAYMMVLPSGARVEMVQVGQTNEYVSQDSTYTQMFDNGNQTASVHMTGGTLLWFTMVNGDLRCNSIKDRNGNFISISYDANGHVTAVVDTMNRTINFNYRTDQNLDSITQGWSGQTHLWASFEYGQVFVQPNFSGLFVNGPNGASQTVLTRVTLGDGSRYNFDYNAAFGQVNKISHYSTAGWLLSYTSYNVDASAGQTDCPRFTEQRDWARYWNNDWDGVPASGEEAVTSFSVATDGSWSQVTMPDLTTVHKEFFYTTGWQAGLSNRTEDWSGGVLKKWTTTQWTQDNLSLPYQLNPRPSDLNIYDAEGNHQRTTIQYTSYGLPSDVNEFGADATTLIRQTHTDYNWDSAYTGRHLIGLVTGQSVYSMGSLIARTNYDYDWPQWPEHLLATPTAATQHDEANFGPGTAAGRGNRVLEQRWDVNNNTAVEYKWGYNTDGSVVFARDPLGHQTTISYTDSFKDGANRNTYAYPSTVTDPDGFSASAQYDYDMGLATRSQTPSPNAGQSAPEQTMTYDWAGRLQQITNGVNGAYSRMVYADNGLDVISYEKVESSTGETFSATSYDGAGRVRAVSTDHPHSVGGHSAVWIIYDVMGRISQRTNPTEIDANWVPTGDDATGWVFTSQVYDWKGRPTITTNADGTSVEAGYGGCGCAGGDVTTIRDEAGRRRRMTKDVLGRLARTEELNWDESVYAASAYSYNMRDQLIEINQAGEVRSFAYDGLGRLTAKTTPEQGTTLYSYNGDDTLSNVTDARGASSTYSYNNRHLLTGINYGAASGVAATPNVAFAYDAAGNRTTIWDGAGSHSYQYDQLSRLTSETRWFNELGRSYTLSYQYSLAGELTSVSNPWGAQVGYQHDLTGRLTAVTGSGYYGVTNYINSISYRAWGAAKQVAYGNHRALSMEYNNRLRLTRWDVSGSLGWQYSYGYYGENNTGRVTYAQNLYDRSLDRSFDYDQAGRLIFAFTGTEAQATIGQGPGWEHPDGPFAQGYEYDQWGNMTRRYGWGGSVNADVHYSYTNNRNNAVAYDAAGNLTNDGGQYSYNALGQQTSASYPPSWQGYTLQQSYDGEGLRIKKVDNGDATYYLRSSVLGGQVVCELNSSGDWVRGYVYAGGELLAIQLSGVHWVQQDPLVKSQRMADLNGNWESWLEMDPFGGETARSGGDRWSNPQRYGSYRRDGNGNDEAGHRNYHGYYGRFDQADPFDGSYRAGNPQSFNRYAYVQNDPVNFIDPSGLNIEAPCRNGWVIDENGNEVYRVCHQESGSGPIYNPGYVDASFGGGDFGWGGRWLPADVDTEWINAQGSSSPPQQMNCGVNPITDEPGFSAGPKGQPGHLRPGVGGGGEFHAPRNHNPGGHQGIDISAPIGYPVYANRAGTLSFVGQAGLAGNLVIIDHGGGVFTRYGHLESFAAALKADMAVEQGQVIGFVGQTGNAAGQPSSESHVHFGVQLKGPKSTPVNPATYLNSPCP